MSGYIGSKASVTLVDGYTQAEADAEFVAKAGDTMTGGLTVGGSFTSLGIDDNATSTAVTIDSAGRVTTPYQPRFSVGQANNTSTANNGTLVFTNVSSNPTGSYNTSTGAFTAPIAGTYQFNFTVRCSDPGAIGIYWRVQIYKNGAHTEFMIGDPIQPGTDANQNYVSCVQTSQLELAANDYVNLRMSNQAGKNLTIDTSSAWSGHLIG